MTACMLSNLYMYTVYLHYYLNVCCAQAHMLNLFLTWWYCFGRSWEGSRSCGRVFSHCILSWVPLSFSLLLCLSVSFLSFWSPCSTYSYFCDVLLYLTPKTDLYWNFLWNHESKHIFAFQNFFLGVGNSGREVEQHLAYTHVHMYLYG